MPKEAKNREAEIESLREILSEFAIREELPRQVRTLLAVLCKLPDAEIWLSELIHPDLQPAWRALVDHRKIETPAKLGLTDSEAREVMGLETSREVPPDFGGLSAWEVGVIEKLRTSSSEYLKLDRLFILAAVRAFSQKGAFPYALMLPTISLLQDISGAMGNALIALGRELQQPKSELGTKTEPRTWQEHAVDAIRDAPQPVYSAVDLLDAIPDRIRPSKHTLLSFCHRWSVRCR